MRLLSCYGIAPELFDQIGNSVSCRQPLNKRYKHGSICYMQLGLTFHMSLIIGHQEQPISKLAQLKKGQSTPPLFSYVPRDCLTQLALGYFASNL